MKILCLDSGIFVGNCAALAEGGKNKVFYHTHSTSSPFPNLQNFAPGTGYEHIKKITEMNEVDLADMDMVVNLDVGRNDEIIEIKKKYPELSVVGAGYGKVLEENREGLKKWLKVLGLDVQDYKILYGIDALEEYSKNNTDIFVKIDIFRQSMETLKIESYEKAVKEQTFIKLRKEFGNVFGKNIKFIVEKKIDSEVEIGIDCFFSSGLDYLNKVFIGYEWHKGPYICKVADSDDMPKQIDETMSAFIPVLEKMDYRGPLSTEELIMKDGKHYLIDFCARLLSPGSALYPYAIKNWADALYGIGKKEYVELDIPFKFYGALPLFSEEAKEDYIFIDIKDRSKLDVIRFGSVCSDGKDFYGVKGLQGMCVLVAGADKWQDVIDKLKELNDAVNFDGKDDNYVNMLNKFPEIIKKGEAVGISF